MSLCRTCLSKNDLKLIFPDKNLTSLRSEQLYLVCGIKIEVDDGMTQLICSPCLTLVEGALKLREQSAKAEETFKLSLSSVKIESEHNYFVTITIPATDTVNLQNGEHTTDKEEKSQDSKIEQHKSKNVEKEVNTQGGPIHQDKFKNKYTVRIEDFESSNDSDFMDDLLIGGVQSIDNVNINRTVCIEDFESSDDDYKFLVKKKPKKPFKYRSDYKEKEILEKGKRKMRSKEDDQKLLSLAVAPFASSGPIKCKLCSKEVRNLQTFKCHAKTHFEPQNACEECGKKFVNVNHMRYHQQRVHGRRKRLACGQCSYRAVDRLQLQNHKRAEHTGERPFICDVCGASFRMRANIAQHMRMHFGVRKFQCERCPGMFRSRSELTNHQNRVHNHIYTYLCYLCPETYKGAQPVKRHLVNVHGVPESEQLPIKCVRIRRRSGEGKD